MAKADLSRDYYGDLELPPTADLTEIKKQFKKLALAYHPDRNPGRENEVTAKFQKIQSAHEVLIDPQERAKYDANRIRNGRGSYYGGPSSEYTPGTRGNPWSNVSSQFPPPPKPPTARARPSAGAQRYTDKFKPPTQSAYQAAQNGPDSRKDTYNAFDRMYHRAKAEPTNGSGSTSAAPEPPPRGTPKSGREESNARAEAQAKADRTRAQASARPQSSYDPFNDYRNSNNIHRSNSTSGSNRRTGFQPNTPGGDEPPASKGAYFTARDKPMAPPPPPRQPPPPTTSNMYVDPLEQFRKSELPSMETRSSQPYNTRGGEKFSLFGTPSVNRSNSTREDGSKDGKFQVPKVGSDSNLRSPQQAQSSAQRPSSTQAAYQSARVDTSSSDELPEMQSGRTSSSANKSNSSAPRGTEYVPNPPKEPETTRKQSKISQMRQWMKENPGQKPPPDGFPADGPPLRTRPSGEKTNGNTANDTGSNQPSMYAHFDNPLSKSALFFAATSYPVSRSPPSARVVSYRNDMTARLEKLKINFSQDESKTAANSPSGHIADLSDLNAFEKEQMNIIDRLISTKRAASWGQLSPESPVKVVVTHGFADIAENVMNKALPEKDYWASARVATKLDSPSKKPKKIHNPSFANVAKSFAYGENLETPESSADNSSRTSFNLSKDDDMFNPTRRTSGFSSSAENISTKFASEDWEGKFEAGADYLNPAGGVPLSHHRSQSMSRSRGRSPPKVRTTVDPKVTPVPERAFSSDSPGGTKFSAEEWSETFKHQTFMPQTNPNIPYRPQPGRKRTFTNSRSNTGGQNAESDSSEGKPPRTTRRSSSPQSIVPDPMEIDTPPPTRMVPHFVPSQVNEKPNTNLDPSKRATGPSPAPIPVDEEDLTINFEDLNIKGFNLTIPPPPIPPQIPSDFQVPSREAFDKYVGRYAVYMKQWDDVSKQFLLHFVGRQTQNNELKDSRWTEKSGRDAYRLSVNEDVAVLQRWADIMTKHEKVVKEFVIMEARVSALERGEQTNQTPTPSRGRKKTH